MFRPELPRDEEIESDSAAIISIMESCWKESPHLRPTMRTVRRKLRMMNKGQ